MTIRMLQAWNGLPEQLVTTLSSSEESRLVGLGLASFDLDGPAENVRMAQLATDAAGNPISIGGVQIPRSSGKTAVILGDSITGLTNSVSGVSGIVRTGGVSVATSTSHGLNTGATVRLYNTADAYFGGFGGWFVVTRIDANTFSYPQPGMPDGAAGAGVVLKTNLLDDRSYFNWLNILMGQPFALLRNAGLAGEKTNQIYARIDTDVLPLSPDFVFVLGGINDVSNGVPAATIKANLQATYQKLLNAGITVVALSVMPYGSGHASFNATNTQTILDVNDWIKRFCAATAGMIFVDAFAATVNPTGSGAAASGMLYDNLHPAPKGALAVASACKAVLQNKIFSPSLLVSSNSDNYGTNAANTNICDSAPWTTSGGTVTGPATGTAAAGFNIEVGAGSPSLVASVQPRADGIGYNQRIVVTASAASDVARIRSAGNTMNARFVSGGSYELVCDFSLTNVAGSNLSKINCPISLTLDGTLYTVSGPLITSSNGSITSDIAGIMRSPVFTLPAFAACTAAIAYFDLTFSAAGSAITMDIGRLSVRRVG